MSEVLIELGTILLNAGAIFFLSVLVHEVTHIIMYYLLTGKDPKVRITHSRIKVGSLKDYKILSIDQYILLAASGPLLGVITCIYFYQDNFILGNASLIALAFQLLGSLTDFKIIKHLLKVQQAEVKQHE